MRHFVFEKGKTLKGGLHCHTTRSDGKGDPADVIRLHKQNGYDFLTLSDHRIYNFKNFAPDVDITIIPGMEYDNGHPHAERSGRRCYHSLCLGPVEGNGYRQDQRFERSTHYTQEDYQKDLDEIHANHNITFYCHPDWSATPPRYFERLKGYFAMEVWNSCSVMEYDCDKDAPYWDEILGQGIKIFGVAVDDGHKMEHHCHGWVQVNAENNVDSILHALETGDYYSTCGPEIYEFYIENDTAVINCSGVSKIRLHSEGHPNAVRRDPDGNLTHAEFKITDDRGIYPYARISITDKDGKMAWTNPIFTDED